MHCNEARAAIPKLIDGLLDYEDEFAVQQHINGCRECQARLRAYERDQQAISRHVRQVPYAPVARDVIAEIERRRSPWWDAFRSGGYRLAGVVGLVMVILIVGAGAWSLREIAMTDPADNQPAQDVTLSSPEPEMAAVQPELIGAADITYIIGKLDDAGLVFEIDASSEADDYAIEYGRIAFDRHLTFVEYRAEAVSDDIEVFLNVSSEPGGGGQSVPFKNGEASGWLALSAIYPGASHVFLEDYHADGDGARHTYELTVDLSALPYYNEGITRYQGSDANAGVEVCCLTVERGVAISTLIWDWEIVDADALAYVDESLQPIDEPPLLDSTAGPVWPDVTIDGESLRMLDTSDYRALPLEGSGVGVYALPAEGSLKIHLAHLGLPAVDETGNPAIVQGPWTLSAQIDDVDADAEPEPTVPPDVAKEPTPTLEPDVEMTPVPSDDDEAEQTLRVLVYMVRGDEVGASAREIEYTRQVATAAIRALLSGPNYQDEDVGFHTEIPAGVDLLDISLDDETLTVDLSSDFAYGGGSASMLMRLAQVVHTATQFDSVDNVRILIEGEPVDALGGEGVMIDGPLDRSDFEDQAPAILLETPAPHEVVGNEIRLRGTANTFEANLQVEIIDPMGNEVYRDYATATSGSGTRGEFDISATIDFEGEGLGTIRLFEHSARDGERINIVTIPVRFEQQ